MVGTAAKADDANTSPNVDANKVFDRDNFDFKDIIKNRTRINNRSSFHGFDDLQT
ncbi:hypothetical protein ACSO1_02800 [Acinetobacter calcoaceticus]|nr:hypothetical protein ACSO1_02800 [Acinetobacter calcoaceticus]